MKRIILSLCFIAHTAYIAPAAKRNLQARLQQLAQEHENLRQSLRSCPITEVCPTKPPKKYSGSREKVRLQRAIDKLSSENLVMRAMAKEKRTEKVMNEGAAHALPKSYFYELLRLF